MRYKELFNKTKQAERELLHKIDEIKYVNM